MKIGGNKRLDFCRSLSISLSPLEIFFSPKLGFPAKPANLQPRTPTQPQSSKSTGQNQSIVCPVDMATERISLREVVAKEDVVAREEVEDEAERQKINQTKPGQDELRDDDGFLWSSKEEGVEEFDEEEEEDEEGAEEHYYYFDDDYYYEYEEDYERTHALELSKMRKEGLKALCRRRKMFLQLVLDRRDVKRGTSAAQVYERLNGPGLDAHWLNLWLVGQLSPLKVKKLKDETLTQSLPKSDAMKIIDFAIRYYSDKSCQQATNVNKLIRSIPCTAMPPPRVVFGNGYGQQPIVPGFGQPSFSGSFMQMLQPHSQQPCWTSPHQEQAQNSRSGNA